MISEPILVALALAVLLGVSIGVWASGIYANWRLRKILSALDPNGAIMRQLNHERALRVNKLYDLVEEMKEVHVSAGGVIRKLDELQLEILSTINEPGALRPLRQIRLNAEPRYRFNDGPASEAEPRDGHR